MRNYLIRLLAGKKPIVMNMELGGRVEIHNSMRNGIFARNILRAKK